MINLRKGSGFTIIELLIVIVVIAILAAVTIVAYNGIAQRAKESSIQSDLVNGAKQLKLYAAANITYPTANNCTSPGSSEVCLRSSQGTVLNYIPNNTTAPTSFVLRATNGTTRFSMTDTSVPSKSTVNQVTLTNLISNGDFSNGSSNWTNHCNAPSTCVFSNGVATLTADSSARAVFYQEAYTAYTDNDKIFYSALIKKQSGSDMSTRASRSNGGYDTLIMTTTQFNSAPIDNYIRHSGLRTFVANQGSYTSFIIGAYSTGMSFQSTIDNVVVINLTACFGAGNEPSVSQMNDILTQFDGGWFNGTVPAVY